MNHGLHGKSCSFMTLWDFQSVASMQILFLLSSCPLLLSLLYTFMYIHTLSLTHIYTFTLSLPRLWFSKASPQSRYYSYIYNVLSSIYATAFFLLLMPHCSFFYTLSVSLWVSLHSLLFTLYYLSCSCLRVDPIQIIFLLSQFTLLLSLPYTHTHTLSLTHIQTLSYKISIRSLQNRYISSCQLQSYLFSISDLNFRFYPHFINIYIYIFHYLDPRHWSSCTLLSLSLSLSLRFQIFPFCFKCHT